MNGLQTPVLRTEVVYNFTARDQHCIRPTGRIALDLNRRAISADVSLPNCFPELLLNSLELREAIVEMLHQSLHLSRVGVWIVQLIAQGGGGVVEALGSL